MSYIYISGLYIYFFSYLFIRTSTKTFTCPNLNVTCPKNDQYLRSNIVILKTTKSHLLWIILALIGQQYSLVRILF